MAAGLFQFRPSSSKSHLFSKLKTIVLLQAKLLQSPFHHNSSLNFMSYNQYNFVLCKQFASISAVDLLSSLQASHQIANIACTFTEVSCAFKCAIHQNSSSPQSPDSSSPIYASLTSFNNRLRNYFVSNSLPLLPVMSQNIKVSIRMS